jgi:hypothetical protein
MRGILCVILVGMTVSLPGWAAPARPNFSGTWALNAAESDFGQAPPPIRQSEVITQAGDEFAIAITLEREQGKQHYTLRFQVGGTEMPMAKGSFPDDSPFRILNVKGEWDGPALVVTEKVSFQGQEGTLKARYSLSADGKVLRKATHISMNEGEFDTKTVYGKQ